MAALAMALAVLAATVATQEPQGPWPAVAVAALAVAAGSVTSLGLLRLAGSGRRARSARLPALRRGGEVGAALAILAALQLIGGLNPLTALFVALSFATAEYVLTFGGPSRGPGR